MEANKMKGKFQDDQGDFSMGRLIVFIGVLMSVLLVVVGCALAVYEVVIQSKISQAGIALAGLGAGIYTSGAISKAWQAHAEAKKMAALPDSPKEG